MYGPGAKKPEDYPEFEEIGRQHPHPHRTKLPVIPDLRFEYSYLKSIQRFVEVERGQLQVARIDQPSSRYTELVAPREVIEVQWRSVLWVTMRDQVISPLVQGALWALASYYLNPLSSRLGVATFENGRKPTKGVSWLRNWLPSLRIKTADNRGTTRQPR